MTQTFRAVDYMELFLALGETEGVREVTLRGYRAAITKFLDCPSVPDDVRELGPQHALAWTAHMRRQATPRLKDGAIHSYQRPVWSWLRWLFENEFVTVDIARRPLETAAVWRLGSAEPLPTRNQPEGANALPLTRRVLSPPCLFRPDVADGRPWSCTLRESRSSPAGGTPEALLS